MIDPSIRLFRDKVKQASPWWLSTGMAERVLYVFALLLDVIAEGLVRATHSRFPGYYSAAGTLARIGRDRKVVRAPSETDAEYEARLIDWLRIHTFDGTPWGLLRQLRLQLLPRPCRVATVNDGGHYYEIEADGTEWHSGSAWDFDSKTGPSRYWVLIYASGWQADGTWGDAGEWGDGGTIGSDATPEEVEAVRLVVRAFNPPHATCESIIVVLDQDEWDAALPETGDWDRMSQRNPNCAYWRAYAN